MRNFEKNSFLKKDYIIVASLGKATKNLSSVRRYADAVELRGDLLQNRTEEMMKYASTQMPVVLTVRSVEEGGNPIVFSTRKEIYLNNLSQSSFVDVEIASFEELKDICFSVLDNNKILILSYHNYDKTPSEKNLEKIYYSGEKRFADVVKIATTANDIEDVKSMCLFTLKIVKKRKYPKIAILCMGEFALISRICLPIFGSYLVFGHCGKPTAPGQPNVKTISTLLKGK